MTSTMNFKDLTNQIIHNEKIKEDYLVPAREMVMNDDSEIHFKESAFQMNPIAHTQLAARLQIPNQFYQRIASYRDLRSDVVNRLLSEDDRTFFFRTHDDVGRAFLSDRYKPIDNMQVLAAASPVLRDMPIEFLSASISDARMYLQVSFPGMEGEVEVGDTVRYGLTITNSEVGMGMVRVSPTLWRLVCSNGMVRQTAIKHRHVGRQMDMGEDYGIYRDETRLADQKAFRLKLQDTIQMSVNEAFFEDLLGRAKSANGQTIEKVAATVKNVTRHFQMDESREEDLMDALAIEGRPTRWKISNAVTGLCHKTASIDTQFEYEKIGMKIIDMGDREWKGILAA